MRHVGPDSIHMTLPFMFGIWVGIDVDQAGILRDFITAIHYSVSRVR